MSLLKFLSKKSTLIGLGVLVMIMSFMPLDAFAQADEVYVTSTSTGPFEAFLQRAAELFMQTRNALYIIAAFAFIQFAWTAIKDGKVENEKIFYLVVGLVILGVAGWMVSYLANPGEPTAIMSEYEGIGNTQGWGETN